MEDIRNEEGSVVLPQSQYNPIDPVNGAVYLKDEEYEAVKAKTTLDTPKSENPSQAGTGPTEPDTTTPSVDYDAIVKEKTGGKFEKWDDLISKADKPGLDLDDTAKQIIENLQQGKYAEVTTFLTQQQILGSLDKLGDEDAIKLRIQIENPDYTDEDVADEYDQKYGIGVDKEDVSDEEFAKLERRVNRKQKSDAKEAREALGKLKTEIRLPSLAPQSDPEVDDFVKEVNGLSEEFAKALDTTLPQFTKLDLSINDKDVQFAHEFSIDDAEKAELGNVAKDFWSHIQSRYYKDGKYDTQQYLKDLYIQRNFGKILKSAVTRAINLGKIDVAKGVANITDPKTNNPSTSFAEDARRKGMEEFAYS
jgi:hypothetical protein